MSSITNNFLSQNLSDLRTDLSKTTEAVAQLKADLAKIYPEKLSSSSNYKIVRLVQSVFFAITKLFNGLFYAKTIKDLNVKIKNADAKIVSLNEAIKIKETIAKNAKAVADDEKTSHVAELAGFVSALVAVATPFIAAIFAPVNTSVVPSIRFDNNTMCALEPMFGIR